MTSSLSSSPRTDVDDLLTRTGSGDEQAFAALYDNVAATVDGSVRRTLRDTAMAEEVTQEVWYRVWRWADCYTPDQGSAPAWMMALTHRTVIERIRSARTETASAPFESAQAGSGGVLPAAHAGPNRDQHLSLSAQRRAVLLAYYQGCTCEQISARTGVPHETVATMIHSGLLHLRAQLRPANDTAVDTVVLAPTLEAERW